MNKLIVAAIQMVSGNDLEENLQRAAALIAHASERGAGLVVLPENFALFSAAKQGELAAQEASSARPLWTFLSTQAALHRIWLVGGTVPVRSGGAGDKVFSTSYVFDDSGRECGVYHKMHLFDVDVADAQGHYRESDTFCAGDRPLVVDTPFGRLGVAVCYDLRFPELFRAMLDEGAELIALPSAFTLTTGEAHWLPLLRARAIENQCYLIGANQGGRHNATRSTSGGSVIVDGWGVVLAEAGRGEAVVLAPFDREALAAQRAAMPVGRHRRFQVSLRAE